MPDLAPQLDVPIQDAQTFTQKLANAVLRAIPRFLEAGPIWTRYGLPIHAVVDAVAEVADIDPVDCWYTFKRLKRAGQLPS